MNNMHRRWYLGGALLVAAVSAGCDVSVGKCERDDAGDCVEVFPDDEDGSVDGAVEAGAEGGVADAGTNEAGAEAGAPDAGTPDAAGQPLTIPQFCMAVLSRAVAWRDALADHCINKDADARDDFLAEVFSYERADPEGSCITAYGSSNITFDPAKAQACADAYLAHFPAPPGSFPEAGIDLAQYRATIRHGAPVLVQIPACREAAKGKLTQGQPCASSFECSGGLRCIQDVASQKTCQPAFTAGNCDVMSDCADGYTCSGAAGNKTCVSNDQLPLSSACEFSFECANELDCVYPAARCGAPVADVICTP